MKFVLESTKNRLDHLETSHHTHTYTRPTMFSRQTRLFPSILTIHTRNINTLQEALRVLKLESSTTIDVAAIKNSYYDLSKELHPDKNVGKDTTEAFNRLNLAYQFCVEHAQNNLFNSPHRQTAPGNPRNPRPVSFRKGFGQRTAYTGETLKKTMTYVGLKSWF